MGQRVEKWGPFAIKVDDRGRGAHIIWSVSRKCSVTKAQLRLLGAADKSKCSRKQKVRRAGWSCRVKMCAARQQEVTQEVPDAAAVLCLAWLIEAPLASTRKPSRCAAIHSPMPAPSTHQWQSPRGRYYRLLSHTPLAISQLTPRLTAWTQDRSRLFAARASGAPTPEVRIGGEGVGRDPIGRDGFGGFGGAALHGGWAEVGREGGTITWSWEVVGLGCTSLSSLPCLLNGRWCMWILYLSKF